MGAKTMANILSGMLLFTIALMSAACQRSESSAPKDSPNSIYLGNLDKKLSETYGKENEDLMSVCDFQWRPRILELARVLEEKRAKIDELSQKNNTDVAKLTLGEFTFINDLSTPAGKDEWQSFVKSWSHLVQIYEWIKDNPDDQRWVYLNRMARAMVADDDARISYGEFYSLSRTAGPVVLEIKKKVDTCMSDAQCTDPLLSYSERNFLVTNVIYEYYVRVFRFSKKTFEEKREVLKRFAKRIRENAERYEFHRSSVIRTEGDTLIVPLDLTAFGAEGSQKFIELVEKEWNTDKQYKIKIESVTTPGAGYKVGVETTLGGRASVNWKRKTMNLFNWGRLKTIAHEFGHVLGLNDTYFTTFDVGTCAYTQESNSADLMSSSSEGAVLPHHWDELKKQYWNK